MSTLTRLRAVVTVEYEYEAPPEDYGTNDPKKMATIDMENWLHDPHGMMLIALEDKSILRIDVQPVEDLDGHQQGNSL